MVIGIPGHEHEAVSGELEDAADDGPVALSRHRLHYDVVAVDQQLRHDRRRDLARRHDAHPRPRVRRAPRPLRRDDFLRRRSARQPVAPDEGVSEGDGELWDP